jgi:ABC-type multidrug transport system fused ATPase/permease subunit
MAGGPLGEFLCLLFDLVLMFVLTAIASIYFLPIILLVMILNFYFYRHANKGLRSERRELSKQRGPGIAHFAESVQGTTAIKVFGKGKTFTEHYDELMNVYFSQRIKTAIAVNFFSFKMMLMTALLLLLTGFAGLVMVHRSLVSVGSLGVAFTFIMMTSTTIQQFFEWLSNLEEALTGIERMDHYLRLPLESGARLPRQAKFSEHQAIEFSEQEAQAFNEHGLGFDFTPPAMSVSNLVMRYRLDLDPVLNDISFDVKPGEQLAIVGKTGSGKSSLIQALYCLYPIESGSISIGGFAPDFAAHLFTPSELLTQKLLPLIEYRKLMALIPQEPSLFRGSIRLNLARHTATDDQEIWSVLENIGIRSWVETLGDRYANGLDYVLMEGAKNLSLGERQLLCLARALLQKTNILIMDEATSSIDPASEKLLVQATKTYMKSKTRIIVAHRLSTIEEADRVLWLNQGRIEMLDRPEMVLPRFSRTNLQR